MQSNSKFRNDVNGPGAKDEPRPDLPEDDDCGSNQPVSFAPPPTRELIEVEFKEGARSGVEDWDFDKDEPRNEPSYDWPPKLREILESNKLVNWRPSFPLRYPWSRDCSKESARETYRKEGREKFVTLKFSTETDVLKIAKQIRRQPEIAQAVAVPLIAPPYQPLEERFVGTGCSPIKCNLDLARIAAAERRNQWFVRRDNRRQLLQALAAHDADEGEQRRGDQLQYPGECFIPRTLPNESVEIEIGLGRFVVTVRVNCFAKYLQPAGELDVVVVGQARSSGLRSGDLQHGPQRHTLANILRGKARYQRADVWGSRYQAGMLQALQRFPHGRLADIEFFCERQFPERASGRKAAFEDGLSQQFDSRLDTGRGDGALCHGCQITMGGLTVNGNR